MPCNTISISKHHLQKDIQTSPLSSLRDFKNSYSSFLSNKTLWRTFPLESHRTSLCRSRLLWSADISSQSLENNRLVFAFGRIVLTIFTTSLISLSSSLVLSEECALSFFEANASQCRMQCKNLHSGDLSLINAVAPLCFPVIAAVVICSYSNTVLPR